MAEDWQQGGFGIYVHWPFCQSKCPYCDFNSHVSANVDQRHWAKAFVAELERYHRQTSERVVNSVFFGGGTPSLMSPELVETILMCIAENWKLAKDVEITLEANPTSVEAGKFRDFQGAGVNRVSLGLQALHDHDLKRLGRLHSVDEGLRAIEIAQSSFPQVSFDLIYARQDQTLSEWQAELTRALSLGTDHLSMYQLTIEDGTAFGRLHKAGRLSGLPKDDLSADMYALTQQICDTVGMPAYEVSNHAKPWAQSKHNLIYWRSGDFLGVGPGAHGRLTFDDERFATETNLSPEIWLESALLGKGESLRELVSPREGAIEQLMMALRLTEGVGLNRVRALDRTLINNGKLADLEQMGFVKRDGDRLAATPSGRMILNTLIKELIND